MKSPIYCLPKPVYFRCPQVPLLEESCILYTNVERMAVHHDENDGKAKVLCPTTLTRGTRHGLRGIVDIELE